MNARLSAIVVMIFIASGVAIADSRVHYAEGSPRVEIDGILFPVRLGDVIPEGAEVVLGDGDLLELSADGRSILLNRPGRYDPALASSSNGSASGGTATVAVPGTAPPAAHSAGARPLFGFLGRVVAYFGTRDQTASPSTPMGVRGRVATSRTGPEAQAAGGSASGYPPSVSEAVALIQRGDPARAETVLAGAASANTDPQLTPLYGYLRAALALERGDAGAANEILRDAPPDPMTQFFAEHQLVLAHASWELGDPGGTLLAISALRAARPTASLTDAAIYLRAASLEALGEVEFARQLAADLTEEPFLSAAQELFKAAE